MTRHVLPRLHAEIIRVIRDNNYTSQEYYDNQ